MLHNLPVPLVGSLREAARPRTEKGDQTLQVDCAHASDVEIVRRLHYLASGKGEGTGRLEAATHFQVTIAQLLQKRWAWLEDRREDNWQGSE